MKTSIIKLGNPILRAVSDDIPHSEIGSAWLNELIQKLFSSMEETGGVGVAAPQVGENVRVFVFGTGYTKRRTPKVPIANSVLINPTYEILDDDIVSDYEGCLSIPDLMALVPRAAKIRYQGFDQFGNAVLKEADGLEARIIQHETDHLDGMLFIDRVVDTRSMALYSEVAR